MKINISGDIPKHLMEEMQKDKPSNEASFWAKSGCKHCHGRGVTGTISTRDKNANVFTSEALCICAHKSYKKWQEEWLEARKPKRAAKGNGKKQPSEKERYEHVKPRIDNLQDSQIALISEIRSLDDKINSLDHHEVIADLKDQLESQRLEQVVAQKALNSSKIDLDRLLLAVGWIERQLKEKRAEINHEQNKVIPKLSRQEKEVEGKIKELTTEKESAEKALSRASHGMRKRRREAERKLDRVQSRLSRILKENHLESRISTHSAQLSDITEESAKEQIDNHTSVG